jgi:hypothetical protein
LQLLPTHPGASTPTYLIDFFYLLHFVRAVINIIHKAIEVTLSPALPPSTSHAPLPAPLETLVIPSELDGNAGLNRCSTGRAQIAAHSDLDAIRAWLSRFIDTKTTFENYRKEAERLLLWSVVMLGKPLSPLTHETACATNGSSPIRNRPRLGSRVAGASTHAPTRTGARSMGPLSHPRVSARRM